MQRYLLLFFVALQIAQGLNAQNYWQSYRLSDGLIDSIIVDLASHDQEIYIATPQGFSVFEDGNFTNYDTSNSALISQNIKRIKNFNDTVWMATDSGLSQYYNGNIRNFRRSDGLISDTIRDLEVTSDGELWIASLRGISRKRGNQFINDPSRRVFELGINGGDSVYAIVNFGSILNITSVVYAEMYDGNSWRVVHDSAFQDNVVVNELISLPNGRMALITAAKGVFFIDSLFSLNPIPIPDKNAGISYLNDVALSTNGDYWFTFDNIRSQASGGGLYRWDRNEFNYYFYGLSSPYLYSAIGFQDKIVLGGEGGLMIADQEIIPYPTTAALENSAHKSFYSFLGELFVSSDDLLNFEPGFEFPKGRNRDLMYPSYLWIYARDQFGREKLAIQPDDFQGGSVSDNTVVRRPNIFKISRQEVSDHLKNFNDPNYSIPNSILFWPANGYAEISEEADQAPFVDVNDNGCYDPENGDHPFFLGDQAVYMIINDKLPVGEGRFAGNAELELHIMAYLYDLPQLKHVNNSVFIRYTLINRSRLQYEYRVGIRSDYEIGSPGDYTAVVPSANLSYAYNEDNFDEPNNSGLFRVLGYDSILPAVGMKVINRKLESSTYLPFGSPWPPQMFQQNNNPNSYIQRLNARWNDSSRYASGGIGYDPSSNDNTNFLYSGDPRVSGSWSMNNIDFNFGSNFPFDANRLDVIEAFTLQPGERETIDLVYSVGYDSSIVNDKLGPIQLLVDNLNRAAGFQRGIDSIAPEFIYSNCFVGLEDQVVSEKQAGLFLYPNPTNGAFTVLSEVDLELIQIIDLQGKIIDEIRPSGNSREIQLELDNSRPQGIYFLRAVSREGRVFSERVLLIP